MRFHVFYFTPHPKRELRDNTEMWEGQCEKTLVNLKFASQRTSKGLGPWQPKAFLARSELDPTLSHDIPNSHGQRSEGSAALRTQLWSTFGMSIVLGTLFF